MIKIAWEPEHFKVLDKIHFDFDVTAEITDEQFLDIDEKVSDYFAMHGLAGNGDEVNATGRICEDIMNLLAQY